MRRKFLLGTLFWIFLFPGSLLAEGGVPENEDMLFFEEEATQLTIATKHLQTVREAPAIVTVITEKEIRNMGARDLLDILRQVPGFGTTIGYYGRFEFEVRGIKNQGSTGVLFFIDGVPVNDLLNGGPSMPVFHMAIDNIRRIEIIRGPGSALYGSNAFSGVINVVTKQGKEINGTVVSGGRGTFDTGRFDIQAGKQFGALDVALFADYYRTNGPRLDVPSDILGNSGATDYSIDRLDTGLRVAYGDLSLNTRLIQVERGPYIGIGFALNDGSELDDTVALSELAYRRRFSDRMSFSAKGYIKEEVVNFYWEILSEGTGPFTDGMIGNPSGREQHRGGELQFDYRWADAHLAAVGTVVERKQFYDTKHVTNFNPLTGMPLGSLQDITDWGNFVLERTRDIWAVYLQDEWKITEDLNFVLGVRHDRYSDFGSTTNPRVAAVWQFAQAWDAKLMYGTAFLAPPFGALYLINNPAQIGNPDLKPEKMRTYEASVGYSKEGIQGRVGYFHNDFDDKIQPLLQPSGLFVYSNRGGATIQGVEIEIKRRFGLMTETYANYTYQKTEDAETHRRLPDVAAHKGNIGVNLSLLKFFNVNTNLFMTGRKPRTQGDPRKPLPGYALVDLAVTAKEFYEGLEFQAAVHNLLDKEYADPLPPVIPGDLPREGRHFMLSALYRF